MRKSFASLMRDYSYMIFYSKKKQPLKEGPLLTLLVLYPFRIELSHFYVSDCEVSSRLFSSLLLKLAITSLANIFALFSSLYGMIDRGVTFSVDQSLYSTFTLAVPAFNPLCL